MGMFKQSSQNSKFEMSLQYLKKEVRDDVDLFHAYKHQSLLPVEFNTLNQSFLQSDALIIYKHNQAFSKFSK